MRIAPLRLLLVAACAATGCAQPAGVGVRVASSDPPRTSVLTQHNDNARTGASLAESELTVERVRSGGFGFLFAMPVDGRIYAQPLVVADVRVGFGHRDLVFVATEHDSVFAFDANQPGLPPFWQTSLGNPADARCFRQRLLTPEIGITSTPAIDPVSQTIYVVAFTADDPQRCDAANFHHLLFALDLATGVQRRPPTEIAADAPIPFATSDHLQRSSLLLADGVLYFSFASHADHDPYHGWVFAYDAATLTRLAAYVDTPTGEEGGIWMSGQGASSSGGGRIYVSTGNGTFDNAANQSDTVLELTLDGDQLAVTDSFTPYNQEELAELDLDLGSVGPMLVPGIHRLAGQDHALVVVGSKEGKLYLLDRDDLGGYHTEGDHVLQTIPVSSSNIDGSPVWFDDGVQQRLYVWSAEDDLKAFTLADSSTGEFLRQTAATPIGRSGGLPGGFLSISANGVSDGIVWAAHPFSPDGGPANAIEGAVPGVLHAFTADLSVELWNTRADAGAPAAASGDFAKFCAPTIANGKVYLPAWTPGDPTTGSVIVFGALP